jgi:hypothetical protein
MAEREEAAAQGDSPLAPRAAREMITDRTQAAVWAQRHNLET